MNWQDEGFIISKRKFRENGIILEIFTSKFGRVSGIVYGGTSSDQVTQAIARARLDLEAENVT